MGLCEGHDGQQGYSISSDSTVSVVAAGEKLGTVDFAKWAVAFSQLLIPLLPWNSPLNGMGDASFIY